MNSGKVYCSSRETFGVSINMELLTPANASNCLNGSFTEQISTSVRVGMGIPYIVWCLVGNIANMMVIILIASKKGMRTIFRLLLLNLAVADLIITGVIVPLLGSWQSLYYPVWHYSLEACKILNTTSHVAGFAMGGSLTFIAIYRFLTITFPRRFSFNKWHLVATIVLIWVTALAAGVSHLKRAKIINLIVNGRYQSLCILVHDTYAAERLELSLRIAMYVISAAFLITLYAWLIRRLKQAQVPGLHSTGGEHETEKNRRQAINMMTAATVVMIVCYFPYMVLVAFNLFAPRGFYSSVPGIEMLVDIIVSLNSVLDPFIYCAFSSQFRKEMKDTFFKCFSGRSRGKAGSTLEPLLPGRDQS